VHINPWKRRKYDEKRSVLRYDFGRFFNPCWLLRFEHERSGTKLFRAQAACVHEWRVQ
jgi:hypothetical protein